MCIQELHHRSLSSHTITSHIHHTFFYKSSTRNATIVMLFLTPSPLLYNRASTLASRSRPFSRHASSFLHHEALFAQRHVASRRLPELLPPAVVYVQRRPYGMHGKGTPLYYFQSGHD